MCLVMLPTRSKSIGSCLTAQSIPDSQFQNANMKFSLALFALGAGLRSASAQDAPPASYGEAFPNGLSVLNPNGLNNIPRASYTLNRWAWGTIPQACYDVANGNVSHFFPVYVDFLASPSFSRQRGFNIVYKVARVRLTKHRATVTRTMSRFTMCRTQM